MIEGAGVDTVQQLRAAMNSVDPAVLTVEDRRALLDLAQAAFLAKSAGGGGASMTRLCGAEVPQTAHRCCTH
jgi:hypothetical protein